MRIVKTVPVRNISTYFSNELFKFLRELKRHNNRDWFAKNKKRYEEVILQPCVRFIMDAGPALRSISPNLVADPRPNRGSLFRIYRDIRFSKDKSPYKTNVAMDFWHKKMGKRGHSPGLYLHIGPGESFEASGVWHPETPMLKKIRRAIVERPDSWKKVLEAKPRLWGESLKRPPQGIDPNHEFIEDLKRKDFVATVSFAEKRVTSSGFMEDFVMAGKSMNPLNKFLAEAIGLSW